MVVEDRALALAERLTADGQVGLAARLRETVPETFGNCDEHVPMLRAALTRVRELPEYDDDCRRILDAIDDLPRHIGRGGRVWLWQRPGGTYSCLWDADDWLEQGPEDATLEVVTEWAARRSDDVRFPEP